MNDFEKRAFVTASSIVLTESLPENFDDPEWFGSSGEDIEEWIGNHACEFYDHCDSRQLWEQIDTVADMLKEFHKNEAEGSYQNETLVKV